MELLPVQLGGPAVVLLLGVRGQAVVATEEGSGLSISTKLHLPQLLPAPVGVQVGGPDEGQVDAQGPVYKGLVIQSILIIPTCVSHCSQCR